MKGDSAEWVTRLFGTCGYGERKNFMGGDGVLQECRCLQEDNVQEGSRVAVILGV